MRFVRSTSIFLLILLTLPVWAQQSSTASPQGPTLLQQALGAIAGSVAVSDVTLTGTARRIAGSDDETATVTLQALASGQSQLKFSYPSGPRSEVVSISSIGAPIGSWTGPDGVAHAMAQHNLWTDSSWFFPALTISKLLASQVTTATAVGQETKDGIAVVHLVATQSMDVPAELVAQMQHLSQMDLHFDSTTRLPAALDFNVHPDNNMLLDIPVEVRFSDYRAVSGVQVPFHIQKYLNNGLILDIQLQTATLNSGLTASAFVVQ